MVDKISLSRETKEANKSYSEYVINERWKQHRSPEYFEYRRKWVENPKNMVIQDFPIHMDVEITNYCNLLCPMCPRTIKMKNGSHDELHHMSFDLFKKIIDEGSANGLCSVKFNYSGEPLMHKDVAKMVKYCKDNGILDVMFNTNAVLLTEQMSRDLLEAGIDGLYVSFDSPYKETYESIRVGAKFEKVVENVKTFSQIRNSDERFWKTQLRVSKVLFPDEKEEDVLVFINMWKDIVDAVGFGTYMEDGEETELPYNPKYRCDQPWQRLFVKENGIAFPCCRDNKLQYIVGDANNQSVKEIWHGDLLKKLRAAHASGNYNTIEICKNCQYLSATAVKFE